MPTGLSAKKNLGSITFTFLEHGAVSKNLRIYDKAAVQEAVRNAQADLAKGIPLTSFATHGYAQSEDPTKMVGRISKIWEEGTKVKGTVDLFDTEHARALAAAVKGEGLKTVSLRAGDFAVAKDKRMIGEQSYDVVDRFRLNGVDFAMRPGLDIAQVESFAFESEGAALHRDVVVCETTDTQVVLTEEQQEGKNMTEEEVKALVARILADQKPTAVESKHTHVHEHEGGDGKKYKHEHGHNHDDKGDGAKEDHMHSHEGGYGWEDLGAYGVKDLARALAERVTTYVGDGTPAAVLEAVTPFLTEAVATLTKAGVIKEAANPQEAQLTEALGKEKTLAEALATLETERQKTKTELAEALAKQVATEAHLAKVEEALVEAQKPGGRRIPIGQLVEMAIAEAGIKNPDEEITQPGKTYKSAVHGWAAAIAAADNVE